MEADLKVSILDSDATQINSSSTTGGQVNPFCAGFQSRGQAQSQAPPSNPIRIGPPPDAIFCRLPTLIAGPRCYSDASTTLDGNSNVTRSAGLGIFFLDPNRRLKYCIRAKTEQITSVLMAESEAMALAAKISSMLGISEISAASFNWKVFKIHRELNTTAHVLANQVFRNSLGTISNLRISCTNERHVHSCPLKEALTFVTWESISLLAASCC